MGTGVRVRPVASADTGPEDDLQHGYPPPWRSAGTVTIAYCGAPMVVTGGYTETPPDDACPMCAAIWAERRRQRSPRPGTP